MNHNNSLLAVDRVSISIIVDNSIDLLMASSNVASRFPLGENPFEGSLPIAEHGFSALINVHKNGTESQVLFDAGISPRGTLYNLDVLDIDLKSVQAIILSHGHPDHALGLPGIIGRLGKHNTPLILHPDAYLERKLVLPNGSEVGIPAPGIADLRQENVEIIEQKNPSMIINNQILVSGEVARTTTFENGFPIHYAKYEDAWEPDPFIMDDQCAIINVKEKGLVIITGCGHSGIINVVHHAQSIAGIKKVYAIIGGFHLTGGFFEPIIPQTIRALQKINPAYVMPGHCTGWAAIHQIAQAMPDAYIPNNVGTTLML